MAERVSHKKIRSAKIDVKKKREMIGNKKSVKEIKSLEKQPHKKDKKTYHHEDY